MLVLGLGHPRQHLGIDTLPDDVQYFPSLEWTLPVMTSMETGLGIQMGTSQVITLPIAVTKIS